MAAVFDPDGPARGGNHGTVKPSLRAEKKAMTRRQLTDVAIRRFLDQGYDATTLEEIADEVRISLRTLLRYFASKEHLFHAWHHVALDRFKVALAARADGETVLAFWRTWVVRYATFSVETDSFIRHRLMQEQTPALHGHWLMILREYEDLLTEAFTAELGTERKLQARLLSIALVGGNEAGTRDYLKSEGDGDLLASCLAVIDEAERLFRIAGVFANNLPETA